MADTVRTQVGLLARMQVGASGEQLGKRGDVMVQTMRDFVVSVPTLGTAAPVDSVFGRLGAVVAALSDYDASQIDNDSSVTGATVKDALETLDAAAAGLDNDVVELIEVAGGQTFGAGTSQVTFDTTRINTDGAVFAVAIDEIEVLVAGTYHIDVSLAGDYNGISNMHQIIIQVDIGAGFVELPGSAAEINNNSGTTTGSAHRSATVTFDANDKIRVVIARLTASGVWTIDPNAGVFSVTRLL